MNIEAVSNSVNEVDKAILAQFEQHDAPKTAMRDGELRARVAELMESGIERIAIARKANVHRAEFKRWEDGKDEPGVAMALSLWFEVIDAEVKAAAGDFVETPTAKRILKAFEKARQDKDGRGQRGICLAYGASSAGKSTAAEYYESTENLNPSWGERRVLCVRAGEVKSKTLKGLLHLLVADLDAKGIYCDPNENPMEKVLKHVPEGGLLIFDEAQFLPMRRLDELRIFPDKYKIAVAFMGNMAGYKKLEAAKITQIARRVGGARVIIELTCEDVDALLEAYDVGGHKVREMALMIGIQDGGLGMLCETMRTAKIYANASGKKVDEDIFKLAAFNVGAWGEGQ